jgi:long-chain acyl-CoA synthetase
MFRETVAERPDEVAVDDLVRTRTWAQLADRSTRLAHLLRSGYGVAPGGHVAMIVGNRVELVELVLASLFAGAWITPINWHLTAAEITYILEDSASSVVFCDDEHEHLARAAAGARPIVRVGAALDAALDAARDEPMAVDGPAGGTMLYTSGTTGRPKGVKRAGQPSIAGQLGALPAAGRVLGLDGSGPHLVTGPLYHAAPLGFAVMDLHNGAPLVLMPRWDEREALGLIDRRRVAHTHLVPTMFVRLLRLPDEERARHDLSSLRVVLHGAAPISVAVKRRMIAWWGEVLVEYWGASEGGVVTLVDSADWLAHPGTVGRPTRTHSVVARSADGAALPTGETGVLWCRNLVSDQVFAYHHDATKTAASFRGPGEYTIGDLGWVDVDGYVHLADRVSNMIISGGVNIYPAEVEHVLIEHPAVADAAVFGIPDDEWGESVKAAVELEAGVAAATPAQLAALTEEILAFARTTLAGYKVPRSVDIHEHLPRQPTGKILTRQLKAVYWPESGVGSGAPAAALHEDDTSGDEGRAE